MRSVILNDVIRSIEDCPRLLISKETMSYVELNTELLDNVQCLSILGHVYTHGNGN